MRRIPVQFWLVVPAILLFAMSCNSQSSNDRKANELQQRAMAVIASLEQSQIAEVIEASTFITPERAKDSTLSKAEAMLLAGLSQTGIPDRQLSESELRRTGIWLLPDGELSDSTAVFQQVVDYYASQGSIPENAQQIIARQFSSERRVSLLEDSNPTQVISRLRHYLNPVTGKFYQTYQSHEWTPWGINMTVISREDWVKVDPEIEHVRMGKDKLPVDGIIRAVMYGEAPDSILHDYHIFYSSGFPTHRSD
jgi:hypothetical protein